MLEIWLRDSLPQPLVLIANVTHVANDGLVKATLTPPGEAVADLIEKLAFPPSPAAMLLACGSRAVRDK